MPVVQPLIGSFLAQAFHPGSRSCLLSLPCAGPQSCGVPGVMWSGNWLGMR